MFLLVLSILGILVTSTKFMTSDTLDPALLANMPYLLLGLFSLMGLLGLKMSLSAKATAKQVKLQIAQSIKDNKNFEDKLKTIKNLEDELEGLRELKGQAVDLQADLDKLSAEKSFIEDKLNEATQQAKKLLNSLEEAQANKESSDVITLLSSLQKQGRFIDFVMGDISQYPDEQVGAAARVVHRGCLDTIKQFLSIKPVHDEAEGSTVQVNKAVSESDYSFTGNVDSEIPKAGRLIHKGWKTTKLELPKRRTIMNKNNMIISPAEVEV